MNFRPSSIRVSVCVLLLLAAPGAARVQQEHTFAEVHMGMRVRITLHAPEPLARDAARAAFATIAALEETFSDYRDTSELRRLAQRAGEWTPVTRHLYDVVTLALDVARRTGGAFDPTVAPLASLWRTARTTGAAPDRASVSAARELVGYHRVQIDTLRRALRLEPGARLDFGGVAKGYILEQALGVIRRHGIDAALIEAGGDIVAGAPPPGRTGWTIEAPGADSGFAAAAAQLAHAALATSGPTFQFLDVGDVRHSHVLDPRSGHPLTTPCTAYVIAANAALADALATALTVLGAAGAAAVQRQYASVRVSLVQCGV